MPSRNDKIRLWFALGIFLVTIALSFYEPSQGRDPMARMNLIFLSFVVVSLLVGLCRSISATLWAWITFFGGLLLWLIATWFGSPGGLTSVLDTFRR